MAFMAAKMVMNRRQKTSMVTSAKTALSNVDTGDFLRVCQGLNLLLSNPLVASLAVTVASAVQWNLEHLAIAPRVRTIQEPYQVQELTAARIPYTVTKYRTKYVYEGAEITRVTTEQATDCDVYQKDKRYIPLAPPLLSIAARLADEASDTAEAAAQIAQQVIQTTQQKGLLGSAGELIFGKK